MFIPTINISEQVAHARDCLLELLRRVRADERTHDIRIVVLTGLGESEAEHALTLGANEFLTKPVSPTTVLGIAIELMTGVPRHPGPLPPASEA